MRQKYLLLPARLQYHTLAARYMSMSSSQQKVETRAMLDRMIRFVIGTWKGNYSFAFPELTMLANMAQTAFMLDS